MIIPEVVHYFFAQVIDGIEKVASEKGYNVIVALSNESHEKEVINMETLADSLIDGFILSFQRVQCKVKIFIILKRLCLKVCQFF